MVTQTSERAYEWAFWQWFVHSEEFLRILSKDILKGRTPEAVERHSASLSSTCLLLTSTAVCICTLKPTTTPSITSPCFGASVFTAGYMIFLSGVVRLKVHFCKCYFCKILVPPQPFDLLRGMECGTVRPLCVTDSPLKCLHMFSAPSKSSTITLNWFIIHISF